jgi:hypothetical protein
MRDMICSNTHLKPLDDQVIEEKIAYYRYLANYSNDWKYKPEST